MNSRAGDLSLKRGRPPIYVFSGDEDLSESMEKLKLTIEKRRKTQRVKYHLKKLKKNRNQEKRIDSDRSKNDQKQKAIVDGGLILDMAIEGSLPMPISVSQIRMESLFHRTDFIDWEDALHTIQKENSSNMNLYSSP